MRSNCDGMCKIQSYLVHIKGRFIAHKPSLSQRYPFIGGWNFYPKIFISPRPQRPAVRLYFAYHLPPAAPASSGTFQGNTALPRYLKFISWPFFIDSVQPFHWCPYLHYSGRNGGSGRGTLAIRVLKMSAYHLKVSIKVLRQCRYLYQKSNFVHFCGSQIFGDLRAVIKQSAVRALGTVSDCSCER